MNDRLDLDRTVADWLRAAAPPRAPRELLPLVLDEVAGVRQALPMGGRRFNDWIGVSPRLRWAIVGALLAAVLLGTIAGAGALLHRASPVPRSGASNGWVAFAQQSGVRGGPSSIYLVRDGVQERLLVDAYRYNSTSIRAVCPTFSPDGKRLAYAEAKVTSTPSSVASDRVVVITTLDQAGSPIGTDMRIPVEPGPGGDACPAWSPDGQHLAYLSQGSSDSFSGLWVADLNGTTTETLTATVAPFARVSWSPDGTAVAAGDDSGIWLVPVAGGEPRLLFASCPGSCADFAWSPDGTRIAVGGSPGLVFRVDDPRQVVELSVGESPTWSPDGQELAYYSQAIDAGGITEIHCVGCPAEVRSIASDSRTIRGLMWSPDGKRLLYVADDGRSGALMTLSVASAGLSGPTPLTQLPQYLEFTSSMMISWQPVFP